MPAMFWALGLLTGLVLALLGLVYRQGVTIMASLADVNASLATQTQAITDLAGRIPVPVPPAATEADLDAVKAAIDTNTASIAALAPVTP
jgi:hypothetical protein